MNRLLRGCFLLGQFVLVGELHAAHPIALRHTSFSKIKQLFPASSPGLQQAGTASANELHLIRQNQDRNHVLHARMQQYYMGFPVFGGYAILHSSQSINKMWSTQSQPASMNGVVYQNLNTDLGQPSANYAVNGKEALQHFIAQFPNQSISEETVRPMIYIDADHQAHWAYQVSVLVSHETQIPERPTAIVDAQTFQPFVQWDNVKRVGRSAVNGRGFGGNTHAGSHQFGGDYPFLKLTRDDETGTCYMENDHVKVIDMKHRYMLRTARRKQSMQFKCADNRKQSDGSFLTGYLGNGYDQVNGAYSPSNDALYSGNIIYDMYKKWYGVNALEKKGKAMPLIMRVHYGIQYDNAFWDGEQMTFGDGGRELYPLVSLGVGAHEISHGFTERHSDLAYFDQSGGMNESFSDMAAQAAEYYMTGRNSWMIGAEIMKKASHMRAFRFMDHPSRDGMSIDSADQYFPGIEVHHSSGVYNRLFYLLSTQPNWDVRKAFEVMLTANANYWTPTSTFEEGACGILDAAESLNYSSDDVKRVLTLVNIRYSVCEGGVVDQPQ